MNATPTLRAAIRATSAFLDLSEADVAFLIEACEIRTFEPGAILMLQGEPSGCAMLVLEGEVTVTSDSPRGTIPVSTLKAPTPVGELGSLANCHQHHHARIQGRRRAGRHFNRQRDEGRHTGHHAGGPGAGIRSAHDANA